MQKVKLNKIAEAIYMAKVKCGNLPYSELPYYMKLEYLERAREFVRVARALKKKCDKGV